MRTTMCSTSLIVRVRTAGEMEAARATLEVSALEDTAAAAAVPPAICKNRRRSSGSLSVMPFMSAAINKHRMKHSLSAHEAAYASGCGVIVIPVLAESAGGNRACYRSSGLGCPNHPNKLWSLPEADNDGRTMADCRHLVQAHFGACLEHRFDVLRDVAQGGNAVSPRTREYEPTAVEPPEVWPLKLSPRFFKSRQRPSSRYMQLSQCRHIPDALRDIAAGVKYAPAQLRDFAAYTIV